MCKSNKTDWFKDRKWGVFIHYLAGKASSKVGAEISAEEWNRRVDSFDTESLASQLKKIGAGYLFITIGQNSGNYCTPNATYDSITGIFPSKCSKRDLISDLYESLSPGNIKLMVYLPSGAPSNDPVAIEKLEWENGYLPNGEIKKPGKHLVEFQCKWEAVIREWSLRWRDKVCGWWIDGCYFSDDMYSHPEPPNFESFAKALKAGNPDSIVAFNPGVKDPVISMTEYEDYTAGELAHSLPLGYWNKDRYCEYDRWVDGAQLHVLNFLGEFWGKGGPRFPDELVIGHTKYINRLGGVVTWDVPVNCGGTIAEPLMEQLFALGKEISL